MEDDMLEQKQLSKENLIDNYHIVLNAKNHLRASLHYIYKGSDYKSSKTCPCCGLTIENHPISLIRELSKIKLFGLAYFFHFRIAQMIFFMLVLGVLFIIVPASIFDKSNPSGSVFYAHRKELNGAVILFDCIFAIVILIICYYSKQYIYKTNQQDKVSDKPSSFTVMISNLPKNTEYDELKDGIESELKRSMPNAEFEVVDISFAYSIGKFVQDYRDFKNLKKELHKNPGPYVKRYFIFKKPREELEKKKDELDNKIQQFLNEHKDFQKTTYAFVTFKTIDQKIAVMTYYKMGRFRRFINFIGQCCGINRSNPYKKGNLKVKSAPDPSDVMWHNLSLTASEKWIRSAITYTIGSTIVGVTILIVFVLKIMQALGGSTVFDVFISIIIMIFNMLLTFILDLLANYEGHTSYTRMKRAVIKRIYSFTLSNTIFSFLLIFFTDLIGNKYSDGNPTLPASIGSWLITEALLTPLGLIWGPQYLKLLYDRYQINRNRVDIEQNEANKVYTNPVFAIEKRSMQYIRIFAVSLIFSFVFPFGIFIAMFPIVTCFFTDKFLLLRRCSRSREYGKSFSLQVVAIINDIVPLYVYFVFVFSIIFVKPSTLAYLSIPGLMLFIFMVIKYCPCSNKCKPSPISDFNKNNRLIPTNVDYKEVQRNFDRDYHKTNPADLNHVKINKRKDVVKSKELDESKNLNLPQIMQNVLDYASEHLIDEDFISEMTDYF